MKQSGGYIWVDSEVGKRSWFTVLLPRIDQKPSVSETPTVEAVVELPNAGTVLVAEDEEAVRSPVRLALKRAGYTVLTASDGEEALEIATTHDGRLTFCSLTS